MTAFPIWVFLLYPNSARTCRYLGCLQDNALLGSLVPLIVKWADYGCSVHSTGNCSTGPADAAVGNVVSSADVALEVANRQSADVVVLCSRRAADHVYTTLVGPVAWRAPETFDDHADGKGQVASAATDVFMLGGSFLELLCGCERTPYDWLGPGVFAYRASNATKHIGPIDVSVGRLASPRKRSESLAWPRLCRRWGCFASCCLMQAAAAPDAQPYRWRAVLASPDMSKSASLLEQLVNVTKSCLSMEAQRRPTVDQLLSSLGNLKRFGPPKLTTNTPLRFLDPATQCVTPLVLKSVSVSCKVRFGSCIPARVL